MSGIYQVYVWHIQILTYASVRYIPGIYLGLHANLKARISLAPVSNPESMHVSIPSPYYDRLSVCIATGILKLENLKKKDNQFCSHGYSAELEIIVADYI
jgi:hypothetical protein